MKLILNDYGLGIEDIFVFESGRMGISYGPTRFYHAYSTGCNCEGSTSGRYYNLNWDTSEPGKSNQHIIGVFGPIERIGP